MLIIPIGQEGAVRRVPIVTISLIVIMVLIHLYTNSALDGQIARYEDAVDHRNDLVYVYADELEARENGADSFALPDGGMTYAESIRSMQSFMEKQTERVDEAMESGEFYSFSSPEYEEWVDVKEELREAESQFVFRRFGFRPSEPSVFTLISSMFFHGGILHLVFNMIFLWAAGVMMESSWGHAVYGASYFFSGIAATLIHWLSAQGSEVPCVGASGAIAGMMGAYMIVHFNERVRIFWCYFFGFTARAGTTHCPAFILLGFWITGQVFWAVATADLGGGGGVAYWAHIGGFGVGIVLALAIRYTGYEGKLHVDGLPPSDEEIRDARTDVVETARALCNDGKTGEARGVLEHLIEEDNTIPGAHHLLGKLQAEKSEFIGARACFEKAVTGYCRDGNAETALEAFEDLKQNCAEGDIEASFIFALARSVETGGLLEKAAQLFADVATTRTNDPLAPKAGLRAGMIYEQIGQSGAAKQIYRFVEKNATDAFFQEEAGSRIRALEGQADKALL